MDSPRRDEPMRVVIIERTKNRIVFDVENVPPKWCIALRSAIRYSVPTMSSSLCVVQPSTDTAMDYMWWTNRISQIALESHHVDEFNHVSECDKCESGGSCCESKLTLSIRNEEDEPLPIYTDDLISSDPRVLPVHRTFSVVAFYNTPQGVGVETDMRHSFSDGDLVTVLDCACKPPLPKWVRAIQCTDKRLVLERLFADQPKLELEENISFASHAAMVGHISNRQLLYTLKPGERVSFEATVHKGTGRDSIKWSPVAGLCGYRPLFRDLKVYSSKMSPQQTKELVGVCPKGVFDIEDLTGRVIVARPDDCDGCRACVRWAEERKFNTASPIDRCGDNCPGPGREKRSKKWQQPGRCWDCGGEIPESRQNSVQFPKGTLFQWHRFTVETNGSLDAGNAVQRALSIVQSRLVAKEEAANMQPKEYPKLK